jgi:hypothetical protein
VYYLLFEAVGFTKITTDYTRSVLQVNLAFRVNLEASNTMVWQNGARSAFGCVWSATLNADGGSSRQLREGDVSKFRLPT